MAWEQMKWESLEQISCKTDIISQNPQWSSSSVNPWLREMPIFSENMILSSK